MAVGISWLALVLFCGLLALCLFGAAAVIKHFGAWAFFGGLALFVFIGLPVGAMVLGFAYSPSSAPVAAHAPFPPHAPMGPPMYELPGQAPRAIVVSNPGNPPTRHWKSDSQVIDEHGILRIVKKAGAEAIAKSKNESSTDEPAKENSKAHSEAKTHEMKGPASDRGSIELGPTVVNEQPRPDWLKKSHRTVGNVDLRVLTVGPYQTIEECREALALQLMDSLAKYANSEQIVSFEITVNTLISAGVTAGELRREVVQEEYSEVIEGLSIGTMQQLHVLLRYTPDIRQTLVRRLQDYERQERVNFVALLSGGVLSLLGLTFGLLKVDTMTKGYYSKWLLLGVPGAIIAGVSLGTLLLVS